MMNQHVDESAIGELRDIMGDDFGLLVDTFVNDSAKRIDDIQAAIAEGDAVRLRAVAHGFKGSALNISARQLTEYCKQLEYMGRDDNLADADTVFQQAKQEFFQVRDFLKAL